jgi:hypothetical protein
MIASIVMKRSRRVSGNNLLAIRFRAMPMPATALGPSKEHLFAWVSPSCCRDNQDACCPISATGKSWDRVLSCRSRGIFVALSNCFPARGLHLSRS